MAYIAAASQALVTLVVMIGLALRIEHRLTKIETDVTWLKGRYEVDEND